MSGIMGAVVVEVQNEFLVGSISSAGDPDSAGNGGGAALTFPSSLQT